MSKIGKLCCAGLVAIAITATGVGMPAQSASAAPVDDSNITGASAYEPDSKLSASEKTVLSQKIMAQELSGILTQADAKAAAKAVGISYQAPSTAARAAARKVPGAPKSKTLRLTQYPQEKGYYCGPASGYMIAKFHGITKSKYDGKTKLSQTALASKTYMKTDANRKTAWNSEDFVKGLNKWTGFTGVKAYVQINHPNLANLKYDFVWRVGTQASPIAADTVEFAKGAHYNKHPKAKTIGHWIAGYGYSDNGVKISWADPAAKSPAISWSKDPAPRFTVTSASFVQYLKTNGLAY